MTDTVREITCVGTSEATESPLYCTAARWRSYLQEHSAAFRMLQEERELGWKSSALDAWYARRQVPAATSPSSSNGTSINDTKPSATITTINSTESVKATSENASADAPSTAAVAVGTTFFVEADVPVLAERYRQHARRITQSSTSSFFVKSPSPAESPLFLDLGCAPGGVSKYLLEDLQWRGVGVTLPRENGGIDVDPALLEGRTHGHDYLLLDGDITAPPATWHRSVAYAQTTSHVFIKSQSEVKSPALSEELFRSNSPTLPTFHFVNGGAVLDHGQRQCWAKAVEESVQQDATLNGKFQAAQNKAVVVNGTTSLLPSSHVLEPVLPWFSLLVPQLQIALRYVAQGGAIMLVHGAPQCASLFILLRCMEDVVGTSMTGCQAKLLETMHLAKPPVYVLWTNVWANSANAATSPKLTKEATQDAQRRLLESLDPASPRISPLDADNTPGERVSQFEVTSRFILEEKQRFWLGVSDEGFRLAVEGFARYGAQAEALWTRVEAFLRHRRERAEREMATSASQRLGDSRHTRRGRGFAGGSKRLRIDT